MKVESLKLCYFCGELKSAKLFRWKYECNQCHSGNRENLWREFSKKTIGFGNSFLKYNRRQWDRTSVVPFTGRNVRSGIF